MCVQIYICIYTYIYIYVYTIQSQPGVHTNAQKLNPQHPLLTPPPPNSRKNFFDVDGFVSPP